jgi:putative GTP pyrophosphokinase
MPSLDFDTEKTEFREYYDAHLTRLGQAKDAFKTLLSSLIAHRNYAVAATTGRIKDREESIKKFTRKYQGALEASGTPYAIKDYITDLVGLRLVCLYEDEIEPIGALVREHFSVIGVTDKSAEIEGTENTFGYKGLHLDLKLDDDRAALPEYALHAPYQFELQIRTIVQDSWSTLDHRIKYKKSIPASLKRRINTLAALFELADREFRQVRDETEIEIAKAKAEPEVDAEEAELPGAEPVEWNQESSEIERGKYAPLNAFRLLRVAQHFFPDVAFEPRKIDGFTATILECEPTISRGRFNHYLRSEIGRVRRYKQNFMDSGRGETFNAFTEMRHSLYAANPELFDRMLTKGARDNFDAWRAGDADREVGETVTELPAAAPAPTPARKRTRKR